MCKEIKIVSSDSDGGAQCGGSCGDCGRSGGATSGDAGGRDVAVKAWLVEFADGHRQYHDERDPLPEKWPGEVPKVTALGVVGGDAVVIAVLTEALQYIEISGESMLRTMSFPSDYAMSADVVDMFRSRAAGALDDVKKRDGRYAVLARQMAEQENGND